MIRSKDREERDEIENLIVNADLNTMPVGQLKKTTVLNAEVFKHKDNTKFSSILIGIDTDLYLDMLLDIKKISDSSKLSFHFTSNIQDVYDRVVKASNKKEYLYFSDGMLCSMDEDFNLETIKENYYE
jgi:hypothetical protein